MSLCFPSAMARPALMKSPIGPESPHLVLPQSVIALTASHSCGCKFLFAPVTWGGGVLLFCDMKLSLGILHDRIYKVGGASGWGGLDL